MQIHVSDESFLLVVCPKNLVTSWNPKYKIYQLKIEKKNLMEALTRSFLENRRTNTLMIQAINCPADTITVSSSF